VTKPSRLIKRVECRNCVFCKKKANSEAAFCAKDWWTNFVTWLDVIYFPVTARCPYFQAHVDVDNLTSAGWSSKLDSVTVIEALEEFKAGMEEQGS
jgi:hypothetical protein